jgi:ribosomal protein L40E/predicted RNA-binding Zn-ribbon protein involved in translation (DUF1610 family)
MWQANEEEFPILYRVRSKTVGVIMAKKICSKCAEELPGDAKFCSKCGADQQTKKAKQPASNPPETEKPVTPKIVSKKNAAKKNCRKKVYGKKTVIQKPVVKTGKIKKTKTAESKKAKKESVQTLAKKPSAKKAAVKTGKSKLGTVSKSLAETERVTPLIKCPSCGSTKLSVEEKPLLRMASLIFGLIGAAEEALRDKGQQYVCDNCGYKWDK